MSEKNPAAVNGDSGAGARGRFSLGAAVMGLVLFFVLSTVALTLYDLDLWPTEQPIAFNHRLHVEDLDLVCLDCHEHYESETYSGLPSAEVCGFCHEEAQGESAEEQKLVELLAAGVSPEWQPLFRQPPHVFYSHSRHVVVAGLECEACHGTIAESEAPPSRVDVLTMEECLECHVREGASQNCTACHR